MAGAPLHTSRDASSFLAPAGEDPDSEVLQQRDPHVRVLGSKIFQVLNNTHQASQCNGDA
ncbi:MAG: hypothetical protein QF489_02425 [Planctomycetota bacterium]|nr:hypothetical protein [Planctomycetota bacterium]